MDGNKRAALTALFMFLGLNGLSFKPVRVDATAAILALAAGELTEEQLARWIGDNVKPGDG